MTHSILWTLYMIFREPYGNVNIVFFWFCQLMVNRKSQNRSANKIDSDTDNQTKKFED